MDARQSGECLRLDQLERGQHGIVTGVDAGNGVGQRLLEMGLFEGEELEILAFAPLGDPIEVRVRDSRLSLRRSEAARITVRLCSG
jgi:Fe2+ transport system protein FeoA